MSVSYKPLWKMLIDKDMLKSDLQREANLSANVIARMGKNTYINLESIEKICDTLHCTPNDVIEFIDDRPNHSNSAQGD